MDPNWVQRIRLTEEYKNGVLEFLKFVETNLPNSDGRTYCP